MSDALKTDMYEFTMLEAYIHNGIVDRNAVFELFGRKLPEGRQYGVVAGTARAVEAIKNFRFSEDELATLATKLKPETIEYLRNYKFSGIVRGYREGDYWFPYAPLLTLEATLGEGIILETLLLSIFNYDSAVASAASRMRKAAGDMFLMEFGARRVNESAAVEATRATYLAGFNATSNVEAYHKYGVPVTGTAAHAFTLTFPTEEEAFRAQINTFGTKTTLLVDTYDIYEGVNNAIKAAGTELYAVRIDSGDPFVVIPAVREQLDNLGAVNTKIVLSGDVDTALIVDLKERNIPVDSLGVGTSVVTGDGAVACGFVYKLVEVEQNGVMVPVAKKSAGGKKSLGGRKTSYRVVENGVVVAEKHYTQLPQHVLGRNVSYSVDDAEAIAHSILVTEDIQPQGIALQVTYIENGEVTVVPSLEEARALHLETLSTVDVGSVTVQVDDFDLWSN